MTRSTASAEIFDHDRAIARGRFYPGWEATSGSSAGVAALRPTYFVTCATHADRVAARMLKPANARAEFVAASTLTQERDRKLALLASELRQIFEEPEAWLQAPNESLGGRAPQEFLDTLEHLALLRELVEAIKHGFIA